MLEQLFGLANASEWPVYVYPLIIMAAFGLLSGFVYVLLRKRSQRSMYLQDPLFDGPSRSIYGLLDVAVREHFILFRNVDIAEVIRSSGMVSPLPGKIRHHSFDLLLCDRKKMLPKCGIVLVEKGSNIERETSTLRDFCDRVGLPLLTYETGGFFDVSSLRRDVYQATGLNDVLGTCAVVSDARGHGTLDNKRGKEEETQELDSHIESPLQQNEPKRDCKKCGSHMVQRTISKGKHAGQKAWVCETFPTCRHAILLEELAN
ncbi:DUF2726 domain-containing protein [Sansalvadorimonas verongulae]|uniref:DUF2726 domain-containing protein n=1 Tax=Sansalvadorimonas verongulae TaxID=2172824 RepID=UPI0012BCE4A9|nr:DUF2726 domain-containing protein [Sansalvadorimonas verongulae]MTI11920.1 DUF2726 domain-containing protein [Sansalvadorimonas verongulae]